MLLLAFAMIAFSNGRTQAATAPIAPFASVTVDGETVDLSQYITLREGSKLAFLDTGDLTINGNMTAVYNSDPFITFGATTINAGPGPVIYSFLFGTPIVPGLYSLATSTGGVTLTSGVTGLSTVANGGVYAPAFISGYGTVAAVPTNLGVDLGVGPVIAGPGPAFGTTTTVPYGPGLNAFAPTFYDNLEAIVSYTQTDTGSVASWSGAVTLNSIIPEPSSVIMLGMGGLVLGATLVRRRRIA